MTRGPIVAIIAAALAGSLAVAPNALAGGRHGGGRVRGGGRPAFSRPFFSHHFFPGPFFPGRFFPPFTPFGAMASPILYPPSVFYYPFDYESPPAWYDPEGSYSPPAPGPVSVAPPPPPNVVQYPTGRYELRGDGTTTPYTWVWIPNPPPPPPTAPPADASGNPAPASRTPLFRWTDAEGVVHWTDRLDAVPEEHRKDVKKIQSS